MNQAVFFRGNADPDDKRKKGLFEILATISILCIRLLRLPSLITWFYSGLLDRAL